MSNPRYKLIYSTVNGALETVIETRTAGGAILETPIVHRSTDPGWSAFLAGLGQCDTTIGTEVTSVCLCDDVNDDGTTIVPFIRIISIDVSGGTASTIGDFTTDYSSNYVPIGTVSNCNAVGGPVVGLSQGRTVLNSNTGDTWTRPSLLVQSVSVRADVVQDAGNPPTITDYRSVQSDLIAGESFERWECQIDDSANVLTGDFTINTNSGDVVIVLWTELTT